MIDFDVDRRDDGLAVVVPRGRLTMTSARAFKELLGELATGGHPRIVVDLAETTFLDSSGLGALIAGLKSARQQSGDLRIARPTPAVVMVLEMTNMDKVLRARADVESAFDV